MQTLDAFLREANLPPDTGAASKNVITIEQVLSEKKTYDLSQSFEKVGVQDGSQSWKTPGRFILSSETFLLFAMTDRVNSAVKASHRFWHT